MIPITKFSIAIKRFVQLSKMADNAAKVGDLKTVALLNADAELRSANFQFMVRGKTCYCSQLDLLDRTTVEALTQEVKSDAEHELPEDDPANRS